MSEIYEQKILAIEKEKRILEKKLSRSQINLAMSEETNDRKEALLNQVIHDLRASEATLAWSSQENAKLYQQSEENAKQLQIALNELKIQEEQVRKKNEQLAKASKLKDEFLATISHELRTPLNSILGYSQILIEDVFGSLNEKQRQSVNGINNSGNHLLSLINDIIDLTRIQSEHINISLIDVNIEELCQNSINAIAPMAAKKNIHLKSKIPPNLGTIQVDERRIQQVLINLLSNSVKFTQNGGHILLQVQPDLGNQQLQFQVKDTGIGIPHEELDLIFDLFYQVDGKLNRNQGGLGLGLAIVKQIVDLHQGVISVISSVGIGSTFTVSLPYAPILILPLVEPEPEPSIPYILIAEDDSLNMEVITLYLESYGFRFICVNNGEAAVQQAQKEKPALILMDIQMPVMDGLEAISLIRKNLSLQSVPIIAMTALAMTGDEERCLQSGATEYISKPFSLKQLLTIVKLNFVQCSPTSRP